MTLNVGDKRGEWTILALLPTESRVSSGKVRTTRYVQARCSCGTERKVRANNIESGMSRSCGHALNGKHHRLMGRLFEHEKKDPQRLTA